MERQICRKEEILVDAGRADRDHLYWLGELFAHPAPCFCWLHNICGIVRSRRKMKTAQCSCVRNVSQINIALVTKVPVGAGTVFTLTANGCLMLPTYQ